MIAVGRAAAGMFGSIMRQIWPQLISWGVNQLITSNFGNTYIAPGFRGPVLQLGEKISKIAGGGIYQAPRVAANSVMAKQNSRLPTKSFY